MGFESRQVVRECAGKPLDIPQISGNFFAHRQTREAGDDVGSRLCNEIANGRGGAWLQFTQGILRPLPGGESVNPV
jgi:hypothetical protein